MTTSTETAEAAPSAEPARNGRSGLRRTLANPMAMISIGFLLFVVVFGLGAPWLAPLDPNTTNLASVNAAPWTGDHLLGADATGRDLLSRLMWGTRPTLLGCIIVLAVSGAIGVTGGLLAGFYRGRVEAVGNFVSDLVMSMPGIVLLIAMYAIIGPDIAAAMAVYGLIVAPVYFRLVRAIVVGVRGELYVDAAKVVGLSDARIIGRHVLWAVRAPVIIQSAFVLAGGIAMQAGMDFLGLGDPSRPSWGGILQAAFNNVYNNRPGVVWPALLISLTILALVLLGNALRDILQASARDKDLRPALRKRLTRAAQSARNTARNGGSDAEALLSIRDLRIGYPEGREQVREVVHGVHLDVRRGEIRGLVGESGSGKSQIAFASLGILPREAVVSSGSVMLDGDDLLADPQRMREARGKRIAYIPQEPMTNLDPSFTIGAQLRYALRAVKKMSRREADRRLLELLARVGINDPERVYGMYPHQISGGMAQRVLICGAVAADPEVIIADEPTTALDVTVQAEVLELLRELRDERGLAMILVTHNLGVVADLCDSVSVMKDGVIVEQADAATLFASPKEEYTRELLASSRQVELAEAAP